MNINVNIDTILNPRSSSLSASENTKIKHNHVQIKSVQLDEKNNLQEVKKILQNTLTQSSPQAINSLYLSAQDSRLQLYSDHDEKEVYQVFVDRVTQHINSGKARGEKSEQLSGLLDRISQGTEQAHKETRNILSGLGKLDSNTESYIAESITYTRFSLHELNASISEEEQFDDVNDNQKNFSLQVTTREGDKIDINIQQANDWQESTYANKVSVNYEVEGNLSLSEKEALTGLMHAIGSASDSLLAGNDLTQVMGIKNFNGQQLSGFSLALEGSEQAINYSYQHNDLKQTLTGSWSQQGEVKAQFNLNSQLGGNAESEQLSRYLDLLEQASETSYKLNDDKNQSDQTTALFSSTFTDFMQLAESLGNSLQTVEQQFTQSRNMANNLFNETIKQQADRLGLKDEQQALLKEGFNQLADFSASFVAQKGGQKSQGRNDLETGYEVLLSQQTKLETTSIDSKTTTAIKQSQTAEFDAIMQGDLNSRTSQFKEQYQIMAAIDDLQLKGYQQKRNVSEQSKQQIYHMLGESSFKENSKNSESNNSMYILKEGVEETSTRQGFENLTKGFKAGDVILSQIELHKNYAYQAALFTPNEATFQNSQQTQLSIASQKMLLDELLSDL